MADQRVEYQCVGGPLDGQARACPWFFYEPWHDALTMMDEESGACYHLHWTSTGSIWRWAGASDDSPRIGEARR